MLPTSKGSGCSPLPAAQTSPDTFRTLVRALVRRPAVIMNPWIVCVSMCLYMCLYVSLCVFVSLTSCAYFYVSLCMFICVCFCVSVCLSVLLWVVYMSV